MIFKIGNWKFNFGQSEKFSWPNALGNRYVSYLNQRLMELNFGNEVFLICCFVM